MRGSLAVRINSGGRDVHVTESVSALSFSKSAPGGHASAQLVLTTPLSAFADLSANDRVWLYDTTTGRQVWAGYTEVPTPQAGPYGERYDLTALGGYSLCLDRSEKLPYLSVGADGWVEDDKITAVAGAQISLPAAYPSGARGAGGVDANSDGSARQAILIQWPTGTAVPSGGVSGARLRLYDDSIMVPGALIGTRAVGAAALPTGYGQQVIGDTATDVVATYAASGGATSLYAQPASTYPTAPPAGQWLYDTRTLGVGLTRPGAAVTVASDDVWLGIDPPTVYGQLLDKTGARVNMGTYSAAHSSPAYHLLASDVVADLVGRVLTHLDPARVSITATTYPITALSYPDGSTADGVLADLAVFEPDMLFEVLGADETTGLHEAAYRAWPTTPRYLISVEDGYTQPGGEVSLVNRIAVYWTDPAGVRHTTVVTVSLPELATPALGPARIRDADPTTLDDGIASAANAVRWGTAKLAAANRATTAGQATIARRIRDLTTGAWVWPWQIEPGYLVQVMETGRTHRLTAMTYTDESTSAVLTLDDPVLSDEQRLAAMTRRGMTAARQTR